MTSHFIREDLFNKWREFEDAKVPDSSTSLKFYIYDVLAESATHDNDDALVRKIGNLVLRFANNWNSRRVKRYRPKFEQVYGEWLAGCFELPAGVCCCCECKPQEALTEEPEKKDKAFDNYSDKTKRRRTDDLCNRPPEELAYAAQRVYRADGQRPAAKLVSFRHNYKTS